MDPGTYARYLMQKPEKNKEVTSESSTDLEAKPTRKTKLDAWADRIVERELPALKHTVVQLSTTARDQTASARDLSETILRDPGMTSSLLRIANSAYYNMGRGEITTISRAVVLLGFEAIRNLSTSVSIMEKVLKSDVKSRQLELMAQSVFAATQSRAIAIKRQDESPEEVFIAALLYHLGEVAFWCFPSEEARQLEMALRDPNKPRAIAEKEILGFRFDQLTKSLGKEWQLGETLLHSLEYPDGKSGPARAQNVVLGHHLETALRKGWDNPILKFTYRRIADFVHAPIEEIEQMVITTAESAQSTATQLGVDLAWRTSPPADTSDAKSELMQLRKPSAKLQERVIDEIEKLLPKNPDFQLMMRMIIEGIYRGIAMDRTLVAILNPDRSTFKVKFVLGDDDNTLVPQFGFNLNQRPYRLFPHTLRQLQTPIWMSKDNHALSTFVTEEILALSNGEPFFLAPMVLNGMDIGIIYADRAETKRALDTENFRDFVKFAGQANRCLVRAKK